MNSEYEFSRSVRDALLRDRQLVRLLGGTHIFEGYETDTSAPHINVCGSTTADQCSGEEHQDRGVVTLQVWSQSGKKSKAQKLIGAAERALAKAGLLEPHAPIWLKRDFSGSRKLPENGEFQGILRYQAQLHSGAA